MLFRSPVVANLQGVFCAPSPRGLIEVVARYSPEEEGEVPCESAPLNVQMQQQNDGNCAGETSDCYPLPTTLVCKALAPGEGEGEGGEELVPDEVCRQQCLNKVAACDFQEAEGAELCRIFCTGVTEDQVECLGSTSCAVLRANPRVCL